MTWLVIFGLLLWCVHLTVRVGDLRGQAESLERRLADLKARVEVGGPPAQSATQSPSAPSPVDTLGTERVRPELAAPSAAPPDPDLLRPSPQPRAAPTGPPVREQVRAWLEENGLAWAGGAALALGGLFLVTYAAQRGVFTPPLRIASAVVTGLLLLSVSEWLKRPRGGEAHRLASALAAGAGAATLYGAAWASYWLYAFVPFAAAGALLGAVSLGLLALAFRHGEPLAMLALAGGFLAPAVTGPEQWAAPALTAYLALIVTTGYAVAAARRWGQAGMTTLAGAALWGLAGFAAEGHVRVAALALGPVALACLAVEWRRRRTTEEAVGRDSFSALAAAALAAAAGLVSALWLDGEPAVPRTAALSTAALALLSAFAVRRGLAPAPWLALAWVAGAFGLALGFAPPGAVAAREAWSGLVMAALVAAGAAASAGRLDSALRLWASGAAAVALVLAVLVQGSATDGLPWLSEAGAAVLLLGGAAVLARRNPAPDKDLALAIWIWTAGGAALLALQAGLDPRVLPVAAATLGLAAALAYARLGWRGFAGVMLGAAVASLAALLSPSLTAALFDGRLAWPGLAAVAGACAALTFAGAWVARRSGRPRQSAEALETGALIIALTGVFVLLRLWSTPAAVGGGTMDPFLEAGLRTVLVLAAGLMSALAVREDSSPVGRWRGQVLLALGLAHAVVFQLAGLNPLGAWWKPAVTGPPILDSLLLGLLAPAALLAAATLRKVATHRALLIAYAGGAAVLCFAWSLLETRRLFQGASLHAGLDGIGRAEAAAYAVLVLLAAQTALRLGEAARHRLWTITPIADQAVRLGLVGAWASLGLALLVFGYGASPWWGPIERPIAGWRAASLLFGLYAFGALAAFVLAGAALRCGAVVLSRTARVGVVAIVFALLNLMVRAGFRGLDMRPDLREASLETWAFSAVWGLYGFGLLVYGAARRSSDLRGAGLIVLLMTLAKIFLFDMARLDGVVRAASFLAVGALLLAAAVLVRRLSGANPLSLGLGRAKPAAEG